MESRKILHLYPIKNTDFYVPKIHTLYSGLAIAARTLLLEITTRILCVKIRLMHSSLRALSLVRCDRWRSRFAMVGRVEVELGQHHAVSMDLYYIVIVHGH